MNRKLKNFISRVKHAVKVRTVRLTKRIGRLFPLNKKIIVLYAHERKGLCCNPKYIMLELLKDKSKGYKLYWITQYPETIEYADGFKVLKRRSIKYYFICSIAKVFITNDMADETLNKRKGQIFISTWHGGGAFKKAGYDIVKSVQEEKLLHTWYDAIDYMIVSSRYLADKFQGAFHLKSEQILRTGMPRSDVFFEENDIYENVRKRYGLEHDTKIVLYAPTYKILTEYTLLSKQEMQKVLEALEQRFGGKWVFFVRNHYFDNNEHFTYIPDKIICCNDYYDAQELLCAVDCMITDYSSLLWDFSLLKRPCFSYAYEPEKYAKDERDFYIPYNEWCYPKAKTVEELCMAVREFDNDVYIEETEKFIDYLGNYDKGNSAKRFVEELEKMLM